MEEDKKLRSGVILFPLPFVGHVSPMFYLGNLLHSNGFSITIIHTHFNAPDPARFPNFTFRFIEDGQSKVKDPQSDLLGLLKSLNRSCFTPFQKCLAQVLTHGSDHEEPIACLILDPMWQFAPAVARGLGLPRFALRTGGVLALVLYARLPLLRDKGYFSSPESRQQDSVPEVPPLKVKDLPPQGHHEGLVAIARGIKECNGIICNTFKHLEGSVLDTVMGNYPSIPLFTLGPFHKHSSKYVDPEVTQHQTCLTWLNSQAPNSVLYVSFGTLAAISYEDFVEVSWGLARSMQPFLWVVRPKLVNGSDKNYSFPEDFLQAVSGRGLMVPWVPQPQVLAHAAVGAFWTHCGWNSTLESISEGVPMICFPFFGDQMSNARLMSESWKMGLVLDKGLERKEIEGTIRRVMVEKEGDEMRERAAILKAKVEESIKEGGSSYESLGQLTTLIGSLAKLNQ